MKYTCCAADNSHQIDIIVAPQWHHNGVIVASQWHHIGIIEVSQWHHSGIIVASQWHHNGVIFTSQWHHISIIVARSGSVRMMITRSYHSYYLMDISAFHIRDRIDAEVGLQLFTVRIYLSNPILSASLTVLNYWLLI